MNSTVIIDLTALGAKSIYSPKTIKTIHNMILLITVGTRNPIKIVKIMALRAVT